jgi:hemerythrin-like metal-binding protein
MLAWNESYRVDIEVIDEQHKQLFDAVHRFSEAVQRDDGPEGFADLLGFLLDYGKRHFETEEAYFVSFGYDQAASHAEQHAAFVDIVQNFKRRFENDQLIVAAEVLNFLEAWLVEHVTTSDQRYVGCFREHGLM